VILAIDLLHVAQMRISNDHVRFSLKSAHYY